MKSIAIDELIVRYGETVLVECSFEIGASLALVGQSGSGKSLILKALLGMSEGALDVRLKKRCDFDWIRGQSVSFVPQNPFTALSPLTKIKDQMFQSRERVVEIFGWLDLECTLLERYPNELSGGQLQRVVVAMALSSKPSLLLLDEPTTALDPVSKQVMITLLGSLQKRLGFSILFVTHDMGVAAAMCDDICVLKNGKIIEEGKTADIVQNPQEDYTRRLIDADFKSREFRV